MRNTLSTVWRRLLGLLLIAAIGAFLAVTVLFYNHAFTPVVSVTLEADHAGNELTPQADVKVRGLIVGSVASVSSTGNGAVLRLNLQPDKVGLIPSNVTAELLPTTLFGERYVDLEIPANPSQQPLASGDVISQDRSSTAIEVEKVLDDLLPVLQSVQPQKLSATLTAVSQALQGRGTELGQTLDTLGSYVGQLNPQLPTLEHDLSALADVSNTYTQAAPHLINALSNLTVTAQTIYTKRTTLASLYATVDTASGDLNNFLQANKNNLIGVSSASLPTLDVLARYAPEYPCFLKQMASLVPRLNQAFGAGTNEPGLHAKIEVSVSRGPYLPGKDDPAYSDNRGPRCYVTPSPPSTFPQYPPDGPVQDGSTHPPASDSSNVGQSGGTQANSGTTPQSFDGDLGVANSPAEEAFLAELLAPGLNTLPQDVPSWASLLVGPVFRGSEVTLK